ncbi:Rho GTPase-activating protein 27 [Phytophthora ramorum]|nr:Rho GTPase-activating protein 27 [Phytophthora ramorum]
MDPSSARMSDTNTEDTRKEAGETVAKAALANEEPTQMKLTPHADVQASPTNELQQESTDTRNTGRETAGQSIQNRELADPDTNDHPTTEAKSVPRSPKRKVKKGGKSATPKKTKAEAHVDDRPSSQSTAVEVASAARLPAQASFPEDHANVEDPLLLYQQEVTRSFLRRVSSRKVLESESVSIRPPSCREQVERGDQLGSTMSATAKAATDVETQLEESVKVREDNDGDSASPLEHESSQVLNDCDSTVEMRSATTEEPAPIPPTIESAVTDFNAKQEKGDLLGVAIQASGQEVPDNTNDVTSGDHEALAEEQLVPTTTDNLTPQTKPDANEVVDQDFMLPPAEHHRATRKIQGQYRCFVRRRLILDQLRFMLAKERRQARRKKAKKVKTGDTVASESESPVATVAVAVDTINVQAQQVAPDSVSREIGAEMSPRALASEEAEPSKEDAMLRARKDSCEYAFDLFDGSKDTSGEDTVFVEAPAALPGTSDDTTTSSPPTSMMLAELAFSDDTEEPTGTVLIETSVTADAAEVQPHWERYVDSTTSKSFYYNPATNETRWAAPADPDYAGIISHPPHTTATADVPTSGQPKEWQEFLDEASGQMFYYNTKTGESSWEPPADGSAEVVALPQSEATAESAASAWVMYIDPASQAPYYVNVKTLVTSWERPADFAAMKPRAMNAAGEDTYSIAV